MHNNRDAETPHYTALSRQLLCGRRRGSFRNMQAHVISRALTRWQAAHQMHDGLAEAPWLRRDLHWQKVLARLQRPAEEVGEARRDGYDRGSAGQFVLEVGGPGAALQVNAVPAPADRTWDLQDRSQAAPFACLCLTLLA